MPFLVDGDNLLGAWRGRSRSHEEKRRLAGEIFRYAVRERKQVFVVYDGVCPGEAPPSNQVLFSGGRRSADDLILERIRREAEPRGWTVVTNDRPLADRCRHLGSRVERCDVFRKKLQKLPGEEKPQGKVDVEEWLDWFGEDRSGS
jgi:hypothetical protein